MTAAHTEGPWLFDGEYVWAKVSLAVVVVIGAVSMIVFLAIQVSMKGGAA